MPEIQQLNLICYLSLDDAIPLVFLNSLFNAEYPEKFKNELDKLEYKMPEITESYNLKNTNNYQK